MARWLYLAAPAAGPSEPARADVKARAFELVLNVVARMVAGKQYYGGEGDAEAETEEAARFREMVREYFAMHGASCRTSCCCLVSWTSAAPSGGQ